MRRTRPWLALCALGLATLGWGCSGPAGRLDASPAATRSAETSGPRGAVGRKLSDADRATCLAGGGFVQRAGMMGSEGCYHRFRDGGKTCGDGSECLAGSCYYEGKQSDGSGLRGQCARDDIPFGCRQSLKDGRVSVALCVD